MLLAALASVSKLRGSAVTRTDLIDRRITIGTILGLGAAVFVITVVTVKIVIDWPLSLLSSAQQSAFAPAAEAFVLLWGAAGTLGLVTALAPAILAYVVDRRRYLSLNLAEVSGAEAQPFAPARISEVPDDLRIITRLSGVSGTIAVLAPLLTSPALSLTVYAWKVLHH